MAYTILFRRGTDNEWEQANPVLRLGELGFVTDTKRFKIGDGLTNWNSLPYSVATLENGKIPLDQIPETSKIDVNEVSTIAQRDLLTAQSGDLAVVSETNKTYVYDGSNWVEFLVNPDLTGYATEQYVIDSIDNLNLENYQTLGDVNSIVDSAIDDADLEQYATIVYVDGSINDLNLADPHLFHIDTQNETTIFGNNTPHIAPFDEDLYLYVGVTGLGDGTFTSASAFISDHPSASAVYYSTGIGANSMSASYHNAENTAVGYATLLGGGFKNVAIGNFSMASIQPNENDNRFDPSTASNNTAVGYNSLFAVTTGTKNIAIGSNSLSNSATGNSNISIGTDALRYLDNENTFDGNNVIAIGASATVPGNNTVRIGNGSQVVILDNPVFTYADERDMDSVTDITYGLDYINQLRPIEYTSSPRYGEATRGGAGFIADEVGSIREITGYIDFQFEGNVDVKAIAYDQFIPPIVKSIQEVDSRLIVAESDLETVSSLSASVAVLSASVSTLLEGEATYQTYEVSSVSNEYFFSASPGQADPYLTLVKGRKYRFDLSGVSSSYPFAIRESDGITNYVTGTTGNDATNGVSGSSPSNFVFYTVPLVPEYEALIYQSVTDSGMGGVITLVDP